MTLSSSLSPPHQPSKKVSSRTLKELQEVLDDRDENVQFAKLQEERSRKIQALLSFSASDTVCKIHHHEDENTVLLEKPSINQAKVKGDAAYDFLNDASGSSLSVSCLLSRRQIGNDLSASSLLSTGSKSNGGKRNDINGGNTNRRARRLSFSSTLCDSPRSSPLDFRTNRRNSMSESRPAKLKAAPHEVGVSSSKNRRFRRNSMSGTVPLTISSLSSLDIRLDCLADFTNTTWRNSIFGDAPNRSSFSSVDMRLGDMLKSDNRRTRRNSMSGTVPTIWDSRRSRSRSLDMGLIDPEGNRNLKPRRNSMTVAAPIHARSASQHPDLLNCTNRKNRKPPMNKIGSASSITSPRTKTNCKNKRDDNISRRTTSSSVTSNKTPSKVTDTAHNKFDRAVLKARHMAIMGGDLLAGVGADAEQLRKQRILRGECESCGQKCYEVKLFKRAALTIPLKVFEGRCVTCNPV